MSTSLLRGFSFVTRSASCRWRKSTPVRSIHGDTSCFRISEEVRQALVEKRPVVALETAIYTHGFPYPDNIALASLLESIVRTNGGVPATIAVLDGIARVGLETEELIRLAGSAGQETTRKVSRRDLAFVCGLGSPGRRYHGGTTIAGTMVLAHMAGIKVFATGGLGGVHRGGEVTMDISADLTELGRTPVALVSSGCKSFLDIPRTLEYLETQGVPVGTFADGRTGQVDFPGFWTRDSGSKSPMTLTTEAEAAAVIHAQSVLGLQSGLVFGNPIPEEHSMPKSQIDGAIAQAVQEAADQGFHGAANTPFVLNKIKEITGATSVTSNRALIASNAKRGTLVAVELAKLESLHGPRDSGLTRSFTSVMEGPGVVNYKRDGVSKGIQQPSGMSLHTNENPSTRPDGTPAKSSTSVKPSVFVAGSLAVDLACDYQPLASNKGTQPVMHTSNPATMSQSVGGVGHNVARAIHLLGAPVRLCSLIGDDAAGSTARLALEDVKMDTAGVRAVEGARTPQYVAVNDAEKNLVIAMADMAILNDRTEGGTHGGTKASQILNDVWKPQVERHRPSHIVVDANWSPDMLGNWIDISKSVGARLLYEPVSAAKAAQIFDLPERTRLDTHPDASIDIATPNSYELAAMHSAAREAGFFDRQDWWQVIDAFGLPSSGASTQLSLATSPELVDAGVPQQSIKLLPFIPHILTKLGSKGVLLTQIISAGDPRLSSGEHAPYIISRCGNESEEQTKVGGLYVRLFGPSEVVPEHDVVSVNGVGDTFLGAIVAGLAKDPQRYLESLVSLAQSAAVMTLKSKESVSPALTNLTLAGS
ncbi:Pseudouridine-metabolizing bifunctional protein [Sphaceloma murrayae]|uniref:Pseudouridine-metabolizing bifunctional protein n=1 Tax=Sphaceloma murrayae TaxID=2082308 RepID=A0A2K1R381_9PEZI|nr:Pseudouridine-metabolizing bifunctional protein [Sphaceloma murrayae]